MAALSAAGTLFLGYLVLHLPITDFCDSLARRFGFAAYDTAVARLTGALGLAAIIVAWTWPSGRRWWIGTATALLAALAAIAQHLLVVVAIEAIHYPQYALLSAVLALGGLPLETAWLAATGLGMADEMYQFLFLPRGRPTYFDWNDVVLNAIGAAFGSVAVLAISRSRADIRMLPRRALIAAAALCAITAARYPPLPFFATTPGGQRFLQLNPSEGLAVIVLLWCTVRVFIAASGLGAGVEGRGGDVRAQPVEEKNSATSAHSAVE